MSTEPRHVSPIPPPQGGGCARWAVGCGSVALVLLLVGAVAAWWFVGRPVAEVVQRIERLEAQGPLEQRLSNRGPFQTPADGLLSDEQIVRYLEVQRRMQRDLAERAERLERRLDEVDRERPQLVDMIRMAGAYGEVLRLVGEAVDVQAAALDAQGFSAEEYRWVRWEVLRTVGAPGVAYGVDGLATAFTGQAGRASAPPQQTPVPEANRARIEPYREELEEHLALALLGL
jgi:hypothetical protein